MPSLIFNTDEIEDTNTSIVNKSGYAYVGRKFVGKEITWIKLKKI